MGEIIGSPTRFIQGKYIRTFMEIYRNKRQSLFFLVIVFENERVESAINKSKRGMIQRSDMKYFMGNVLTIALMDAFCSALSIIYSEEGMFEKYLFYR